MKPMALFLFFWMLALYVIMMSAHAAYAGPAFEIWLQMCKGDVCEEVRVPLEVPPTPFICMTFAEQRAVEFMQIHPEHRLAQLKCGRASVSM